jgi:divalent metal cation (Fe/Co/Zn/Cd) transporter
MADISTLATNIQSGGFLALIIILALWELIWKGIALWKAARNEEKYWFIAILIINSAGILPILYIFVFQKGKKGI